MLNKIVLCLKREITLNMEKEEWRRRGFGSYMSGSISEEWDLIGRVKKSGGLCMFSNIFNIFIFLWIFFALSLFTAADELADSDK